MSGDKYSARRRAGFEGYGRQRHKSAELTFDERELALRLRRQRMNWVGVAMATGRSVPDLRAALDPTWGG